MSTLLVPWLVYPALLGALSFGCGLLLERVSGLRLPGTLVVPCGFAVLALVAQLAVMASITADLATPAVIAVAVAGFVVAAAGFGGRPSVPTEPLAVQSIQRVVPESDYFERAARHQPVHGA